MTAEAETLGELVERISTITVAKVDRVMLCPKCNEMEVAKAGEFVSVYHECGERMEEVPCSMCNETATRIVNLGMTRIGDGPCEHWESNQEPRCAAHWRK